MASQKLPRKAPKGIRQAVSGAIRVYQEALRKHTEPARHLTLSTAHYRSALRTRPESAEQRTHLQGAVDHLYLFGESMMADPDVRACWSFDALINQARANIRWQAIAPEMSQQEAIAKFGSQVFLNRLSPDDPTSIVQQGERWYPDVNVGTRAERKQTLAYFDWQMAHLRSEPGPGRPEGKTQKRRDKYPTQSDYVAAIQNLYVRADRNGWDLTTWNDDRIAKLLGLSPKTYRRRNHEWSIDPANIRHRRLQGNFGR